MNNLKKPLFWAYAIFFVYLFIWAISQVLIGPFSLSIKIVSGIEAILILGMLIHNAFFLFPKTNTWKYIPLMLGVIFLFYGPFMTLGTLHVLSSGGYNDQWIAFSGIYYAFTPVVGLLMIIFTAIDLILEKRKQQVQGRATLSK